MRLVGDLLGTVREVGDPLRTRGAPWGPATTLGPTSIRLAPGDDAWRGYLLTSVESDGWLAVVVGEVTVGEETALALEALAAVRSRAGGAVDLDRPGHWAVVVTSPDGTIHVLTDRFGTVHVFIGTGSTVAVGTEAAAVESAAGLPSGAEGLDWPALATWCTLGFFVGDRTLRRGVRVVRPSSHATIAPDGTIEEARVWRWHPTAAPPKPVGDLVGDLDDLLSEVLDAHAGGEPLAVPVSGGLDSRTTVAVLTRPGAPDHDLWAYSYGYGRLSPELAVARAVGAARDLPVHLRTVPPYLLDGLDRAAAALEGAQDLTQTRQLGVVDEVAAHASNLVAAHWGDVWFDTMGVGATPRPAADLLDAVLAKFAKPGDWLATHLVAAHLDAPVSEVVRDLLAAELEPYLALEHPEWVLKAFKTDQWSFRWTVPSLRAFHAGVTPRLPFYDSRVADWFLGVAPEVQAGRALQIELLRRRAPDLARVPWEVTGRPLAGPTRASDRLRATTNRGIRGIRRLVGRPQRIRSWEIQLRGAHHRPALDALLGGGPIADLVDPADRGALLDRMGESAPPPAVGYPTSMLVTLAAELRRRR